jgi:hypothetical protein
VTTQKRRLQELVRTWEKTHSFTASVGISSHNMRKTHSMFTASVRCQ